MIHIFLFFSYLYQQSCGIVNNIDQLTNLSFFFRYEQEKNKQTCIFSVKSRVEFPCQPSLPFSVSLSVIIPTQLASLDVKRNMKMGIFCKVNSALITFCFLFFSRKIVQEFLLIFPKIFFLKSPFLGSLDDDHLQGVAISSHYLLKRNLIDFFNSFFFLTVRVDALDNCFISRA